MAGCSTTLEYDIEEEMMERLTYRDKDGFPMMKKRGGFKQGGVERLAAYEDTGLMPAEVRSMSGEWCAMMSVLNSIGGGYTRLRELAEADRDGRLVVLPEPPKVEK